MKSFTAYSILALCVVGFCSAVVPVDTVDVQSACPNGCPGKNEICGSGTGIAGCDSNLCETLQLRYAGVIKICPFFAIKRCVCKTGYARDYNGLCVRVENCPCKCNEVRPACGNSCGQTCDTIDNMCTMDCKPVNPGQCNCKAGYVRCTDVSNECVPAAICYALKAKAAPAPAP